MLPRTRTAKFVLMHTYKINEHSNKRQKEKTGQIVVAHAFNPNNWEPEAGDFCEKFQDNQGCIQRSCLEKPKGEKKEKGLQVPHYNMM